MGAKDLTTPGGLVEIGLDGTVVGEYSAAKAGGPTRYMPSANGGTDTGLLAHPHGIDTRSDLDLLVTSDYADPLTLATSPTLQGEKEDCGTTVRFWKLSDLKAGPTAIAQLPVGKGREGYFRYNAPEASCRSHSLICTNTRVCSPRRWQAAPSGMHRTPPRRNPNSA